jgi:hypothetical protein
LPVEAEQALIAPAPVPTAAAGQGNSEEVNKTLAMRVVRLSGEAILQKVELHGNEQVGVITNMVEEALGGTMRVVLIVNGCQLMEASTIEESGLEDGTTITALLKLKPVPTKKKVGQATADLKADGTVILSGDHANGFYCRDSSAIPDRDQLVDVQHLYATNTAFAVLKADGTVVAWGNKDNGGDCAEVQDQLVDVQHIYATNRAFAALKADGTVVAWGDGEYDAGDCSKVQDQLVDVQHIYSTHYAFAALKAGGSVVTWGYGWDLQQVEAKATMEAEAMGKHQPKNHGMLIRSPYSQ